ncbi:MAG: HAMP domain-containing histidine kinase [Clostridia bacterium]|nr:HAMP domain-containing histidine kinase [Clostridia bacterium]
MKIRPEKKKMTMARRLFLVTSAMFIIFIGVLIAADSFLLSYVNLVSNGVRLWTASGRIEDAYSDTEKFSDSLDEIENSYALAYLEIINKHGDTVFTSLCAGVDATPPFDSYAPVAPEYVRNFRVTDAGDPDSPIGKYFMLYELDGSQGAVQFLALGSRMSTGDTVVLVTQKSQIDTASKVSVGFLTALAVIMLFIMLIVDYKYMAHFSKPIKKISSVTEKMAKQDFSEKAPSSRISEINTLSESVNVMSDSLSDALEDLRQRNIKLQQDIEEERTMDQIRRTFINGVSHELKTPIAIIQGYAEGAQMFFDDSPETAREYLRIIGEESVRMNNMIMSLLEITRYESGAYEVTKEEFDIRELACEWVERNSELLKEKGITAQVDIPEGLTGLGDRTILYSVVNNYMSNAVSHVSGEMRIRVTAEELGDRIRVGVFNTGSYIADKDKDKIWGSFYRVDKAMNRSQGRFGLGLAIVASVQKLHGMDYGVENVGDGVRFWFDIASAQPNADASQAGQTDE